MKDFVSYYSGFDDPSSIPFPQLLPHGHPFWLKSTQADTVVICLHGWTATTYEARPIGEAAFIQGIDAVGPLVPGHGWKDNIHAHKQMNSLKYTVWLEAMRKEIARARELYKRVYIYGQSMGGALALAMACENLVDACAVTAPAIQFPPYVKIATFLLGWLKITRAKHEDIAFFNESYQFESLFSAYQLVLLAKYVRSHLSRIQCPVLECHSIKDDMIPPKVTDLLQKTVTSSVEIAWFNESGHTMPLDVQGSEVINRIVDFFSHCSKDMTNKS